MQTTSKWSAAVTAACFAFSASAQIDAGGGIPSESEVTRILTLCGMGLSVSAKVKGDVEAAVKSWRSGAVTAEATVAKQTLAGSLSQITNDSNIEGVSRVYAGCVKDTIQQGMDQVRNRPRPVSAVGTSETLFVSQYSSLDAIENDGCAQALDSGKVVLRGMCADRTLVVIRLGPCSHGAGSPRTYRRTIEGECRVAN